MGQKPLLQSIMASCLTLAYAGANSLAGGRALNLLGRIGAARSSGVIGLISGAGAAAFWAAGFVAARHGIDIGMSPEELTLHRFAWPGLLLLPLIVQHGLGDRAGASANTDFPQQMPPNRRAAARWGRALILAFFGGPPLSIISYAGFLIVPLGHGGLIQPSCAALGGLLLATTVVKEKLPCGRVIGAIVIIGGVIVIGSEALATIGTHGLLGDVSFVLAGFFFATFAMLLRLWRIAPMHAAAVVSAVSLIIVPIHWLLFGFERMIAFGLWENLLQAVVQGGFAGGGAIYLFARAVVLLGAARAALFPSLVPPFTLLIGFLTLSEIPSVPQFVGLAAVVTGFWLTQKA
jgi:drug/metabolite transporter (DMT)-like permease